MTILTRIAAAVVEHGRATEWLTSFVMLSFAVILALPGDTMSAEVFSALVDIGFHEVTIGVPLALVASMRLVALYINGNWRRSPMLRLIGASIGSSMFAMLAMAFLWPTIESGRALSPAVGTYLVLALFDGLAAYRSGADARLAHSVFRA